MKPEDFVHLHCHSTYSLLEALPSPEEIVERAKELKQTAVGLADKGYVYGLVEFYQAAKKAGLKPILGIETYVAARTRLDQESGTDTKRYPLVLLAENAEGYQNLLSLATHAALEGMYYKPRVDAELLGKYGKGLIALTGPIGGAAAQAALAEDGERITALVEQYRSFFGPDNVYFELMDLPAVPGQMEANQQLIAWGKKLNVPLVATCNSHYCRPQDTEAHDVLLCIQKNANVADPTRFSMRDSDFSMRPFEEMERAFSHVPEALAHTRVIADRCAVTLQMGKFHIPHYPVEEGKSEAEELKRLAEDGFYRRFPQPTAEQRERLDFELKTIDMMGFSGYFLIVADFINEAKRRGIAVGPGRGSAAGSIVSYCLNITTLNPLEHGLIFERFLNPERISLPDIDTDFADTRRDEVLEYVRRKYGVDHVVQICTFGTLAARAAVKDVGRAYGVPFLEMNALAKLITDRPGTMLQEALGTQELKTAYESNETYRKIIDTALKLEGKARHISVHACGVVITEEPTTRTTALQRAPKDEQIIITQFEAKSLEALGLLKMDFLGLTNLTVIQTALEIIERLYGMKIVMADLPLDDAETYRLLQRGDTTGVFQLESAGMRRYLKQLIPTKFGDITAMAALYRPGPMEWIPSFIKRKTGKEQVEYLHEDLKPIFEETYGIGVYQEQILKLARIFAGFTLGEADILRKAIGKKIKKELDAQRDKFIRGAEGRKYSRTLAEKIFEEVILPFAGYGFPKAHAACYARIAFETAYLKAHFPTEFMAALLSSDAQRTDRVMIEIEECRQMGIRVLPPDINESLRHFTAIPQESPRRPPRLGRAETGSPERSEGRSRAGSIRFGLSAIKGIGDSSVQQIIEARGGKKFDSIEDFARRVPSRVLNKKLLEALAKSGALDSLGPRRTLAEHYDRIADYAKASGDVSAVQTDLFAAAGAGMEAATIEFPDLPDATLLQKLQWEKETLGMYVSSHPLAGLKKYIAKKAQLVADLTAQDSGKKVKLAGLMEGVKRITTKKGETMAVVTLEDPTGKIEVTLFPRVYAESAGILEQPDTVLVVGGTVDLRGGQLQIRADALKRAVLSTMIAHAKEEGFFDEEEARRGLSITRKDLETAEQVELVDEEGNVIAGETVKVGEGNGAADDFLGPLGQWILQGMSVEAIRKELGLEEKGTQAETKNQPFDSAPVQGLSSTLRGSDPNGRALHPSIPLGVTLSLSKGQGLERQGKQPKTNEPSAPAEKNPPKPQHTYATEISIHTITLPERAPKKLLLDLKHVLETFPGREKVQLKIGPQVISLPLTINMSTVLEKRIEEVLAEYAVATE